VLSIRSAIFAACSSGWTRRARFPSPLAIASFSWRSVVDLPLRFVQVEQRLRLRGGPSFPAAFRSVIAKRRSAARPPAA
jgi:hypothetical protein